MPAAAALEFAGARVSVTSRDERERERERDLGLQRRRSSFYKRRGGGGFHPGRRSDDGGSGAPQCSTELLGARWKMTASSSVSNRYPADSRWAGKWALARWAVAR
jgi:hypothetical protein